MASATVLLGAACGGGGSTGTTTTSGSGSGYPGNGGRGQAFTAYAQCMKQNGVTLTLPSAGARPGSSRRPDDAGLPSGIPRPDRSGGARGGFPGGGAFQKPAGVDDATWQKAQAACASLLPTGRPGGNGMNSAYRNCLQQHGVTLGGNLNTTDPNVKKAMEICQVLRPSVAPSPSA